MHCARAHGIVPLRIIFAKTPGQSRGTIARYLHPHICSPADRLIVMYSVTHIHKHTHSYSLASSRDYTHRTRNRVPCAHNYGHIVHLFAREPVCADSDAIAYILPSTADDDDDGAHTHPPALLIIAAAPANIIIPKRARAVDWAPVHITHTPNARALLSAGVCVKIAGVVQCCEALREIARAHSHMRTHLC